MGEIKSTLDLVLEKTSHLSLSSEEKQALEVQEVEKRIKGMLQKYQDGVLTLKELKNEYGSIKKNEKLTAGRILIKEITGRLGLLKVNEPLLEALGKLGGFKTAGLKSVIEEFRGTYRQAAGKRSEKLKNNMLAGKYCISGSAVVPNLAADEQWRREEQQIRSKLEDSLDRVKAELLATAQRAKGRG